MTSQKGAPVVLGVKRGTPRAPSPSMQSEGKPLHATPPPSWPGCAHWLREWAPMRSASKTCARSATSLDPQHGVVVMETWRQCIRSILWNPYVALTSWQLYHVMGAHYSPLVLYTDYKMFSIFLDMSKAVDQTHSKKHTDSYLPQTNIINK